MIVRDMLKWDATIDVFDDVCEALAIAFCGPLALTPEGEEHFAEVLDYPIQYFPENNCWDEHVVVNIDAPEDKVWKRKLRKAREFFESAAGYCADSDYKKWFKED